MASSHITKSSLAFSELTVTNFGLTASAPYYFSRLAKLGRTLFEDF